MKNFEILPSLSDLTHRLSELEAETGADVCLALVDLNVYGRLTLPENFRIVRLEAGEKFKTPDKLIEVWQRMSDAGLTRRSLMVNIGGGMATDLGGFAAATFKRGIRFVNVPTTLLAAVDAGIGGKTGVNLGGLKNEVGAFAEPVTTLIVPQFFSSLPQEEWLSGIGELAKTRYIADDDYRLVFDRWLQDGCSREDVAEVLQLALQFKKRIVDADPHECGLRKCLNFGHTVGHALESLALENSKPIPHGVAVAYGIAVELILSHRIVEMPSSEIYRYVDEVLKPFFPRPQMECRDYPRLLELMHHDKKNRTHSEINFTAIRRPGEFVVDSTVPDSQMETALDIFRDLL